MNKLLIKRFRYCCEFRWKLRPRRLPPSLSLSRKFYSLNVKASLNNYERLSRNPVHSVTVYRLIVMKEDFLFHQTLGERLMKVDVCM